MRRVQSGGSLSRLLPLISRGAAVLVALGVLTSVSCSGRTERQGSNGGAGGSGMAGATSEAGATGEAGAGDGGSSSGPKTGDACDATVPTSCASDGDLCCRGASGATCRPMSVTDCGKCGAACNTSSANSCVDGECACGDEPACSGSTPYCYLEECVQCRNDGDCTKEGLTQCVEGTCRQCDPEENAGCSGYAAACNEDGICVRCNEKNPCPAPLHCDLEDSRCKGCAEHHDCPFVNAPICVVIDDVFSECQACKSDEECAERDPERGQCLDDGTCSPCDPSGDVGCEDQECRYDSDGGYSCQSCESHSDCDDLEKPLCDEQTGACLPCTHPNVEESESCAGRTPGAPVCVTGGAFEGQCRLCDPTTHQGCWDAAPYCHESGLSCEECLEPGDCADGFECSPNLECIGCTTDADCTDKPSGAHCVDVEGGKACRPCDPKDHSGCTPPTPYCTDIFTCSTPP